MRKDYYLFVLFIVLLMGFIYTIKFQTIHGFSIVYFDNTTVPPAIVPNVTYTMAFNIESHERSPEKYSYIIYINNTILKQGTVSIAPGSTVQVTFNFSIRTITYRRMLLWERKVVYNLSGIWRITGRQANVTNTSLSLFGYLLPAYPGPANLNFLLNTSRNATIVKTVEDSNRYDKSMIEYQLQIIYLGDEKYKVIEKIFKVAFIPNSIVIKVVVKTTRGKFYQITKYIPVVKSHD